MVNCLRVTLPPLHIPCMFHSLGVDLLVSLFDRGRRGARPVDWFRVRGALAAGVVGHSLLLMAAELVAMLWIFWVFAMTSFVWLLQALDVMFVTVFTWEAKVLQMHTFDVVKLSILRIVVDWVWMLALAHLKLFEYFSVSIIMPTEEAILLAPEPSASQREVQYALGLRIYRQVDVVRALHVLG